MSTRMVTAIGTYHNRLGHEKPWPASGGKAKRGQDAMKGTVPVKTSGGDKARQAA